jgi:hypothetical protein
MTDKVLPYIQMINHNVEFDSTINETFYDWKVTTIFYIAVHYIKAYAKRMDVMLDNSHKSIFENINPNNPKAKIKLSPIAHQAYSKLFNLSLKSRYEGFIDLNIYLISEKIDYKIAKQYLKTIIEELEKQSFKIV